MYTHSPEVRELVGPVVQSNLDGSEQQHHCKRRGLREQNREAAERGEEEKVDKMRKIESKKTGER